MYLATIACAIALSTSAFAKVIIVKVAPGGELKFSPNSFKAAKGDQIQFEFESAGHSVAEGDFDGVGACQPSKDSDAWWSGFVDSGTPKPWTITVDTTEPYPFYCAAPGHCQAGMVGVINPAASGDETLAAYQKAAGNSGSSKVPTKVQGGVFKAASGSKTSPAAASSSSSAPASSMNGAGTLVMNSVAATIPLGVIAYLFF